MLLHLKKFRLYYGVLLLILLFDCLFLFSPIWYDESWRIMRVIDKSYLITNKLNYSGFPYGLQIIGKITSFIFGNYEFIFRFPILVISLATSVLFIKKWKNILNYLLLISIILLFNSNHIFFTHSIQYKQLASDATLYFLCFLILLKDNNRKSLITSLVLFVLSLFSMNTIFFVPVFILFVLKKEKSSRVKALSIIVSLVSIGITYLTYLDGSAIGTFVLEKYWAGDFIKLNSLSNVVASFLKNLSIINLFFSSKNSLISNSFAMFNVNNFAKVCFLFFIFSALYQKRKNIYFLSLIIIPFLEINVLSVLHKWPIGDNRVNIFLMPLLLYLFVEGYIYLNKIKFKTYKYVFLSLFIFVLFAFFLNTCDTITTYAKYIAKPIIRKTFDFSEPLPERVADGMKCTVKEILKVNKPNDTILLYHFLSEPVFGFYSWHYNFGDKFQTRVKPENIFNNVDYFETTGRGYLPDHSEKFFQERFKKGSVYIIMIVGTEEKFANMQIERAGKYGKFVKFVPCRGLVASWHFAPK